MMRGKEERRGERRGEKERKSIEFFTYHL